MRVDLYGENGTPSTRAITTGSGTLLIGPANEDAVRTSLRAPYCGFFECDALPPRDEIKALLRIREGGLILSLTSRSAWSLDLTGLVSDALAHRFGPLPIERRRALEQQVSETVTDALMRDTFGLDPAPSGSLSGLLAYLDRVEARLHDPAVATRRLTLRILSDGQCLVVRENRPDRCSLLPRWLRLFGLPPEPGWGKAPDPLCF